MSQNVEPFRPGCLGFASSGQLEPNSHRSNISSRNHMVPSAGPARPHRRYWRARAAEPGCVPIWIDDGVRRQPRTVPSMPRSVLRPQRTRMLSLLFSLSFAVKARPLGRAICRATQMVMHEVGWHRRGHHDAASLFFDLG